MKKIKEFLKGEIHINIIDAIALTIFTLIIQISNLSGININSKYLIIIFILLWILARVIFMRYIFNRDNRD